MKKVDFLALTLMFLTIKVNAQITIVGGDTTVNCGTGASLTTIYNDVNSTSDYSVSAIPYTPDTYTGGTAISMTDDDIEGALPIGFTFCFFGNTYTQFYIGSNGWVGFSPNQPTSYTSAQIPSTAASVPKNCIAGPWQDWDPSVGSNGPYIRYQTLGVAPFRRLVVSYSSIPMYSCNSNLGTFQIVLYETTNIIENFIFSKPHCSVWNGTAVQGLHNASGTVAVTVPGRNSAVWTVTSPEGTRYTPSGPDAYVINWYVEGNPTVIANGPTLTIPMTTGLTSYVAEIVYDCNNAVFSDTASVAVQVMSSPNLTVTSAACTCDGSITAGSVSGGVGPYIYNWDNGMTGQTISGLCPGSYTVTVTDGNGCQSSSTGVVGSSVGLLLTSDSIAVSCFGGSDGSSIVTPLNGTAPYFYSWIGSSSTDSIASGLPAGTYTVTVFDINGCSADAIIEVTEPLSALSLSTSVVNVSCIGAQDGIAVAEVSGGTPGYSYSWSNGTTNDSIINVLSGTYTVTVTDANGCQQSGQAQITEPLNGISLSLSISNVSCFGNNDGQVIVSATGGSPAVTGYNYQWNTGSTNDTITSLVAGTYIVTVTDSAGCLSSDTAQVSQPLQALDVTASVTDVNCYAGSDGVLSLTVSGGTPSVTGYSYSWSTGSSSSVIAGLTSGWYVYTVSDSLGCVLTDSSFVGQPTELILNTSASAVSCTGLDDGTVSVTANGGVLPYTYSWTNGSASSLADSLAAGLYTVTVSDAHGCTKTDTARVMNINPLSLTISKQDPGCNGAFGYIAVTASGGSGTYAYSWSQGSLTDSIGGLGAGSYTVTVTSQSTNIPWVLYEENFDGPLNWTLNMPTGVNEASSNIWKNDDQESGAAVGSCSVSNTGDASLYVGMSSDTTGAVYNDSLISNVSSMSPAISTVGFSNLLLSFDYMGMGDGFTDNASLDCSADSGQTWINVSPSLRSDTCSLGEGEWSTIGFALPTSVENIEDLRVRFVWTNNNDSAGVQPSIAINNLKITSERTSLACTIDSTITLVPLTSPTVSTSSTTALCQSASGTASASVTSGTAPYTYSWNTSPSQSTATATGLLAGVYQVTVTDSNGCQGTAVAQVTQQVQIITINMSSTDATCSSINGTSTAVATSGTSPYTYSWNTVPVQTGSTATGLAPNSYTVSITDANGCMGTGTVQVGQSTQGPQLSISTTPALCLSSNGTATVTALSGTAPYMYSWNTVPVQGTSTATNLAANYIVVVTVTDANGCESVIADTVEQGTTNFAITSGSIPAQCGMSNGQASVVSPTGAGYSYVWSNGDTGVLSDSLGAGIHTVTVTDANGCQSDTTVSVESQGFEVSFSPSVTMGDAPLTVTFDNTTEDNAAVSGMDISYSWNFGNGSSSTDADNVSTTYSTGGSYTVTLHGDNGLGCTDTVSVTITVEDLLAIIIPNVFSPNNDGQNDAFRVIGSGIKSLSVDIYNRWGKRVASLSDASSEWDGSGSEAGVYFVIVQYTGSDGETKTHNGHVTLLR